MEKHLRTVMAIFKPQRIDDLRPGLEDLIEEEMLFQYSWVMEDDEQFPGVWAMLCFDERFIECDCAWAPEFDLIVTRDVTGQVTGRIAERLKHRIQNGNRTP